MQKMVMLTEEEWKRLPIKIAEAIHEESLKGYGFKVVARDTDEEITDLLHDWFVGMVGTAFYEATDGRKR